MKLQISKTALEMAVKNICRVINTKNALPILADILCMVDEERKTITMTGSDSEAWLTYQVQLQECEGGGRFCIGADLLRDALSELPEQPVTILATTESDMKFRLQHESGETILPLDNADEYPTPRHLEASRTEWTLESGMLKRVLKRSQFACANDDLRPVMNGMYFDQTDGDTLNIVRKDEDEDKGDEIPEEELTEDEKRIKRMAEEYDQLADRLHRLQAFRDTDTYKQLPENSRYLLDKQCKAMDDYESILKQRLQIECDTANEKKED